MSRTHKALADALRIAGLTGACPIHTHAPRDCPTCNRSYALAVQERERQHVLERQTLHKQYLRERKGKA